MDLEHEVVLRRLANVGIQRKIFTPMKKKKRGGINQNSGSARERQPSSGLFGGKNNLIRPKGKLSRECKKEKVFSYYLRVGGEQRKCERMRKSGGHEEEE